MAKTDTGKNKKSKENDKGNKKGKKKRLGFFRELKAELKRVVWPDKEKMKHSASVVFGIIIATSVLIFAVDMVVTQSLTAVGFYDRKAPRVTSAVEEAQTTPTVAVTVSPETKTTEVKDSEKSSEATSQANEESQVTESTVESTARS